MFVLTPGAEGTGSPRVNGMKVGSTDDLLHEFEKKGVGTDVRLEIRRDDKERNVTIELIEIR